MQEEVENKSVAISIKATKLTANVLKAALLKALEEMEKKQKNPKIYKGKQSVKHLVRQGAGVSNIEITDGNIKSFEKVARKYGIDFALKKDASTQSPRYLVFFKSILMWVILNFGPQGYTTEMADSFGAILGHWLVPFFAPIGLGFWQIAVALIAGISAKEVVVSSCAVLFGVPNINSGAGMDTLVGILSASGFGQLNAFCLMVFCLLYIPCAAALATIRKESGSTRWMLLSALFQLVVAWVVTFIVYRIGLFI